MDGAGCVYGHCFAVEVEGDAARSKGHVLALQFDAGVRTRKPAEAQHDSCARPQHGPIGRVDGHHGDVVDDVRGDRDSYVPIFIALLPSFKRAKGSPYFVQVETGACVPKVLVCLVDRYD